MEKSKLKKPEKCSPSLMEIMIEELDKVSGNNSNFEEDISKFLHSQKNNIGKHKDSKKGELKSFKEILSDLDPEASNNPKKNEFKLENEVFQICDSYKAEEKIEYDVGNHSQTDRNNKINTEGEIHLLDKIEDVPKVYPTLVEFQNPGQYIASMSSFGKKHGVLHIIPPKRWKESLNFKFSPASFNISQENFTPKRPLAAELVTFYFKKKRLTLSSFKKEVDKRFQAIYRYMIGKNGQFLEKHGFFSSDVCKEEPFSQLKYYEYLYWMFATNDSLECKTKIISSLDLSGTSFGKNKFSLNLDWDLNRLPFCPDSILQYLPNHILGITKPMLYLRMFFSSFGWHLEDNWLYSVNYNHEIEGGSAKTWYHVPPDHFDDFIQLSNNLFGNDSLSLLFKKILLFNPVHLVSNGIPVYRSVQKPGEIIVTFPKSFHCGFSNGFSCAESINFGNFEWLNNGFTSLELYKSINTGFKCFYLPVIPIEELVVRAAGTIINYVLKNEGEFSSINKSNLKDMLKSILYQKGPEWPSPDYLKPLLKKYQELCSWYEESIIRLKTLSLPLLKLSEEYPYNTIWCRHCKNPSFLLRMYCYTCNLHPVCIDCKKYCCKRESCPDQKVYYLYSMDELNNLLLALIEINEETVPSKGSLLKEQVKHFQCLEGVQTTKKYKKKRIQEYFSDSKSPSRSVKVRKTMNSASTPYFDDILHSSEKVKTIFEDETSILKSSENRKTESE